MPITPFSLIPLPKRAELAVGVVVAVALRKVTIAVRPGLHVTTLADGYVAGQRVVIALPGGEVAGAQILGPATGQVSDVRQVLV